MQDVPNLSLHAKVLVDDGRMARSLDRIIVVDVECTCWEDHPPPGEESEIIEIGVCMVDIATGERLQRRGILVRPEKSTVSDYCTRLTTLTLEEVNQGISFAEACRVLAREYQGRERAWASYGDFDRRQFERQCASRGVSYPLGITHLNVKNLLAVALKLPHEVGMDGALQRLSLPLEGTHHRGVDDVWNIAAILAELLRRVQGQ